MKVLKEINKLIENIGNLKKIFENDDNFRKKLENEGVLGRLEIEDVEILFLIRRRKDGGESEG